MRHWIKLYTEIVHDPKMGRLSNRQFRTCINLFCLAGIIDDDGKLPCAADLSWQLRVAVDDLIDDLQALASVGILEQIGDSWHVRKWEERQTKPPSDTPAEILKRVNKHRANKRNEGVTPLQSERNEDVTTLEKNRIEKNRLDQEEKREEENTFSPFFDSVASGKRYAQKMQTLEGQVPVTSRQPLVERLLDLYGLRPLVNAGDDSSLYAMHEQAVKLYRMGYTSVESIDTLEGLWREKDWRGKKGDRPRNGQFIEFASQNTGSAKPTRKREHKTVSLPSGDTMEVTA